MSGSATTVYLRGAVRVRRRPNVMTIRFDNSMRVDCTVVVVYIVIFAKSRAESEDRDRKTGPTTVRKDRGSDRNADVLPTRHVVDSEVRRLFALAASTTRALGFVVVAGNIS